jgi:hypothetical protein
MRIIRDKLTWFVLIMIGAAAIIFGFFVPTGEGEQGFGWTHFNGFFAILGFIGCIAIIYVAKWLGHYWLQRKEDYYD